MAALDAADVAACARATDGRILVATRALLSALGRDDATGLVDEDLFGDAVHAWREHDRQVARARARLVFEETVPTPQGPRRARALRFPLLDADGGVAGFGCVWHPLAREAGADVAALAFREAPDALTIVSPDARIVQVNHAFASMLGYHPAELVGMQVVDLVTPDVVPTVHEEFQKLAAGEVVATHAKLRHRLGYEVSILAIARPILDDDGALRFAVSQVMEPGRQVAAEKAAREVQELFRVAFARAPFGMTLTSPEGRLLEVNDAYARMAGYTPDELVGKDALDLLLPEDLDEARSRVAKIVTRPPPADGEICRWRMRHKDGRLLHVEGSASSVRDANGKNRCLIAQVVDVTDRVRAEDALAESERRFRFMIEAVPIVLFVAGPDGRPSYMNRRWTELTGIDPEDMNGASWRAAVHPEDLDRVIAAWRAAVAGAGVFHAEGRVRSRDGAWRRAFSQAVPLKADDGSVVQWFGTVVDVEDLKRAEEQQRASQKLEAVGKLAGGMAHEINNMMAVVLGFSTLMARTVPPTDKRAGHLRQVVQAAERTADITRQLLAFGRRQIVKPNDFDVAELIGGLDAMVRRLIAKDAEVAVRVDGTGRVHADRTQIEQVVLNLVLNARDAIPAGGRLTLEVGRRTLHAPLHLDVPGDTIPAGPWVVLTVRDEGAGMDGATRARAFEPFFTTKPLGQGTGLGLATVYGIVRQAEGYVSLQSEPGKGTTVRVWLPEVAAAPTLRPGEAGPQAAPLPRGTETVLVVEDEEPLRALVASVLGECGYLVLEAGNGREALELLEQDPRRPHAVLADLVMPEMGGLEMARRLWAGAPGLPVLFLSGFSGEEVLRRGLAEGAPFLEKPFRPEALARQVRELLDATRA